MFQLQLALGVRFDVVPWISPTIGVLGEAARRRIPFGRPAPVKCNRQRFCTQRLHWKFLHARGTEAAGSWVNFCEMHRLQRST